LLIVLAYALGFGAAAAVVRFDNGQPRVLSALAADVSATIVIYAFGRIFRNSSFYDPYWSVAPIAISLFWAFAPGLKAGIGQFVIIGLVALWGTRLTSHWAMNWRGLGHEDWRYTELRRKSGRWFWLVELTGIDLMPTLVVFLGCLSLYPALTSRHDFGPLDVAAFLVTVSAILIESSADWQLEDFIRKPHPEGAVMTGGLWAYSRHPNYLGEIMFWWGLFLFGAASGTGHLWAVAGPLAVTALFVFISVPMMDRHNLEKRPGYGMRTQKLPALLPRLNKP
jgi:steroid 5-alpha reductase family enzyme